MTSHRTLQRGGTVLLDLNHPIVPLHLKSLTPQMPTHDPRHKRSDATLDVSLGRETLEAAACTVGTVSLGQHGDGGMLTAPELRRSHVCCILRAHK